MFFVAVVQGSLSLCYLSASSYSYKFSTYFFTLSIWTLWQRGVEYFSCFKSLQHILLPHFSTSKLMWFRLGHLDNPEKIPLFLRAFNLNYLCKVSLPCNITFKGCRDFDTCRGPLCLPQKVKSYYFLSIFRAYCLLKKHFFISFEWSWLPLPSNRLGMWSLRGVAPGI